MDEFLGILQNKFLEIFFRLLFYVNANICWDFEICISVPLTGMKD